MNIVLEKIADWHQKKKPFVVYKKPNEKTVSAFFQHTDELYYSSNFTELGFVFSPFNIEEKSVLIPKTGSEYFKESINLDEVVNNSGQCVINKKDKEFHLKIVDKAIQEIVDKQLEKVVLSRKEIVEIPDFNLVEIFKRLLKKYPVAMVYVWFHPKVGLWFGATPETLVKIKGNEFETMSLAGTQVYNETTQVVWQEKELKEQKFVTDYIVDKLQPICKEVFVEQVQTVKAGNLLHLKTLIKGRLQTNNFNLITTLHPTPAVCGLPTNKAKEFILQNEYYNRKFYTGFLGELNIDNSTELFVNLRCMQVNENIATIYVGGGITKESNPEKEWEETVEKSKTISQIL